MTRNRKIPIALAALGAGGVLLLSACSSAGEPWNDAPIDHKVDRPAVVNAAPDGFANYAESCDDFGNLVITTRDGEGGGKAVAVVKDEEACASFDKGASGWRKAK
ncbi:hypothetical protein DEJ49_33170 [Streptomyces venezuelae]|uniref:Lipoprotein n=1 Tax=Streptomyces venezuelae TaxID=54571 RepID=A0A5P2CQK9_STRVZ|nr:hypothetical protein [Streptomyces venezuelae]QES45194.1 hypothetical protein DEJ49_33170 [Streptomyces venezuelae]